MSWWESAYRGGHVTWDPGEYDGHLPWLLQSFQIEPCRAIDIGCGNGKSAVWLARRGFQVVGVDLAPTAIKQAKALAHKRNVDVSFIQGTFPYVREVEDMEFDLVIERGFLQHLGNGSMPEVLGAVAKFLSPDGIFYSLMVADGRNSGYWGMKRWREDEIRAAVRPFFKIVAMKRSVFTPGERGSIPAWATVMKHI